MNDLWALFARARVSPTFFPAERLNRRAFNKSLYRACSLVKKSKRHSQRNQYLHIFISERCRLHFFIRSRDYFTGWRFYLEIILVSSLFTYFCEMSRTKLIKAYYENVTKMTLVYYSYLQRNTHIQHTDTANNLSSYTYARIRARIHAREDRVLQGRESSASPAYRSVRFHYESTGLILLVLMLLQHTEQARRTFRALRWCTSPGVDTMYICGTTAVRSVSGFGQCWIRSTLDIPVGRSDRVICPRLLAKSRFKRIITESLIQ